MTYYELVKFLNNLISSPIDRKNIDFLNSVNISLENERYQRFLVKKQQIEDERRRKEEAEAARIAQIKYEEEQRRKEEERKKKKNKGVNKVWTTLKDFGNKLISDEEEKGEK